jgi:hypothetical protein
MGYDKRIAFLNKLDSSIWVEKRLFPERLILIDRIERNHKAQDFVVNVIESMPQTLNIMDSLPSMEDRHFMEMVSLEAKSALDLHKISAQYSTCPFSNIEAFLSDLNVYGLREALAYLFEAPGYSIGAQFEDFMINGYHSIGKKFLQHADFIKQKLHEVHSKFVKSKGKALSNTLDRLIVSHAIDFDDAWADGQPQTNFAIQE